MYIHIEPIWKLAFTFQKAGVQKRQQLLHGDYAFSQARPGAPEGASFCLEGPVILQITQEGQKTTQNFIFWKFWMQHYLFLIILILKYEE